MPSRQTIEQMLPGCGAWNYRPDQKNRIKIVITVEAAAIAILILAIVILIRKKKEENVLNRCCSYGKCSCGLLSRLGPLSPGVAVIIEPPIGNLT